MLKNFIVGLLGGVLGAFLFLITTFTYSDDRMGAYILSHFYIDNDPITKQELTPTPLPSSAPDFWERISSEASLSSVAVQVFKDNRIVKSGSGIILSSDGLIVIPAEMTSSGSIYQILYEDKIVKGVLVSFDVKRNLAIIKAVGSEFNLNVSDLGTNLSYQSGQDVLIVGKLADPSRSTTISQKGMVSYVIGGRIVLDTFTNTALVGAKILNSKGELVGILYIRGGKSYVINGEVIDTFFKEYLNKKQ